MQTTATVLGLSEFDVTAFNEQIQEIRVPSFNHLVFVFKDGTEIERVWQDKSRANSWTEEMRAQASLVARRRYAQ